MGVMQKMRNSTASILWLLIISFGILWVLSDVNFFEAVQQGPRSLGVVNGEPISLEEYNSRIQYYTNQYTQQTGNAMTAEQRALYESQAWEELVNTKLISQKMEELGITVTDQELVDMVTGPNPDPFIQQQFGRQDGSIDRAALNQALQAPENSEIWLLIENQLRQKRRQEKLNNFITAGLQVSDEEIEELYIENNTLADINYVRFPYAEVEETNIDVTDEDLRSYYRENSEDFEREENYRFNYVSFSTLPTKQDTVRTFERLRELRDDFAQAENDSTFLVFNESDTPYRNSYVPEDEIREEFKVVTDLEDGEVSEIIQTGGRLNLLKKIDENSEGINFLTYSQDIEADQFDTIDKRAEQADDYYFYATEESSFEEEAEQRGLEIKEAFATKGNTFIAGLGSSQQVMNFLEKADEGDVSEPFELPSQFVVVKVTEITRKGTQPFEEVKPQIENVVTQLKRKQAAVDHVQQKLNTVTSLQELAEALGKEVQTASNIRMSSTVLTGTGREPKVIGAAFGLEEGERSAPIEGNSGVFVVQTENLRTPDISSLNATNRDLLKRQIEQRKNSSYLSVWLEQLKEQADIIDNRDRLLR